MLHCSHRVLFFFLSVMNTTVLWIIYCTGCPWRGAGSGSCGAAAVRRGPGCPVPDTAVPSGSNHPPQGMAERLDHHGSTSGKRDLGNGKIATQAEEEGEKGVRNSPANTKVSEEKARCCFLEKVML